MIIIFGGGRTLSFVTHRRTEHGATNLVALSTKLGRAARWALVHNKNLKKGKKINNIFLFYEKVTDFCPGVPGYCSLDYPGGLCTFECLTVIFALSVKSQILLFASWKNVFIATGGNWFISGPSYSLLMRSWWHLAALSYLWGGKLFWISLSNNLVINIQLLEWKKNDNVLLSVFYFDK